MPSLPLLKKEKDKIAAAASARRSQIRHSIHHVTYEAVHATNGSYSSDEDTEELKLGDYAKLPLSECMPSLDSSPPLSNPVRTRLSPKSISAPFTSSHRRTSSAPLTTCFPPTPKSIVTPAAPVLRPIGSTRTDPSKRSSMLIKRKAVPQLEEDIDAIEDPTWDGSTFTLPTVTARPPLVARQSHSTTSELKRMSVEELFETVRPEDGIGLGVKILNLPEYDSRVPSPFLIQNEGFPSPTRSRASTFSLETNSDSVEISSSLASRNSSVTSISTSYKSHRRSSAISVQSFSITRKPVPSLAFPSRAPLHANSRASSMSPRETSARDEVDVWMKLMAAGEDSSPPSSPEPLARTQKALAAPFPSLKRQPRVDSMKILTMNPLIRTLPPLIYASSAGSAFSDYSASGESSDADDVNYPSDATSASFVDAPLARESDCDQKSAKRSNLLTQQPLTPALTRTPTFTFPSVPARTGSVPLKKSARNPRRRSVQITV